MTVLFLILMLVGFLTADHVVQRSRTRKVGEAVRQRIASLVEGFRQIPAGVELALNHLWLKGESGSVVTIGLDEFIAKFFGAADRIVLPETGMTADCILLQDGERTLRLALPVRGRVLAVNPAVARDPGAAHADPYGSGWLLKVQADPGAAGFTKAPGQAAQWLREQVSQAREFVLGRTGTGNYALMQDGGTPVDGILKLYDSGVWAEFGDRFLSMPTEPASPAGGTK